MERHDSLFEIDNEGWKAQNSGRPLWELFREVLQNHLDSDAENINIHIDTRKRQVITEDDGSGFSDIRDAWSVFGGDKGGDPTMRGRFGRGIKEAIASCEFARVETTSGVVEFDVEGGVRHVDEEGGLSTGTRITMENPDWHMSDIKEIWKYVMKIWQPPGVEITIDLKGGRTTVKDRWPPKFTFNTRIQTVQLNENTGAMEKTYRNTDIHVKDADKSGSDGRLYEMGIPVKLDCEFPYYVDVQQKIPMAEQRNEPNSYWYDNRLKPKLVDALYRAGEFDNLSDTELKKDWFTEALASTNNEDAKNEWVRRIVQDNRKKGLLVATDADSDDKCERHGYQVYDANKAGRSVGSIVESVTASSREMAREISSSTKNEVEPTPAQEKVIREAERLAERVGYPDLTFQTWSWDPAPAAQHVLAEHVSGGGESIVRLNTEVHDWDTLDGKTVGVIIHEIAHEQGRGHNREWEDELERVAGELLAAELKGE